VFDFVFVNLNKCESLREEEESGVVFVREEEVLLEFINDCIT